MQLTCFGFEICSLSLSLSLSLSSILSLSLSPRSLFLSLSTLSLSLSSLLSLSLSHLFIYSLIWLSMFVTIRAKWHFLVNVDIYQWKLLMSSFYWQKSTVSAHIFICKQSKSVHNSDQAMVEFVFGLSSKVVEM